MPIAEVLERMLAQDVSWDVIKHNDTYTITITHGDRKAEIYYGIKGKCVIVSYINDVRVRGGQFKEEGINDVIKHALEWVKETSMAERARQMGSLKK